MSITYHKVPDFPFYSLNQFTQLQPISPKIYLYQHNQSNQIFVIKEVPYRQQSLMIYETWLSFSYMESIVRLRGLCKMVIKYQKNKKNGLILKNKKRNHQISEQALFQDKRDVKYKQQQVFQKNRQVQAKKEKNNKNKDEYLLIFMQKCEQNLVQYIKQRKKQRKPFKTQQITNFLNNILLLLQKLQKQNICHRDIKPQNFLYNNGKFKLCDFDDSLYINPNLPINQHKQLDVTTIEYTSPQFLRNLKQPKQKTFDPYKLDVYALGLTMIYICSMGNFDLEQRRQYLLNDSTYHSSYIKQQRRKYLKINDEYKNFNTIVKMMLEQDQYKRDTFITLLIKIKPIINLKQLQTNVIYLQDETMTVSQKTRSQESQKRLKNRETKQKKKKYWEGSIEKQKKSLQILIIIGLIFYIILLII